ncbi:MAG TPA: sterol desaturase family protein [Polyangiaceae bacterium]|jgi:sterol desaturase/sphingolipid hydroxylase (fatty acid hydroxylase superfamily)|nr:sterol desaturase family protein [Polyangiaceae bacterium]
MEMIIGLLPPVVFFVMLYIERRFAARPLPAVKGWVLKGSLFFMFTGAVNSFLPMLLAALLGDNTLFHLQGLGVVLGGLLGYVVSDFFGYWLHRIMHRVPLIWRWTHQMHHSAERMDLAGMSYTHPFDTLSTFFLTGLATTLLGLSPDAAGLAGMLGFASAVVQHMNIRTPSWIGYFVMRPEAHGLHHGRGIHAYNYANVPAWDMLFGTFRNPSDFPEQYGFWEGASTKMGAMLVGRDVGEPISVTR